MQWHADENAAWKRQQDATKHKGLVLKRHQAAKKRLVVGARKAPTSLFARLGRAIKSKPVQTLARAV